MFVQELFKQVSYSLSGKLLKEYSTVIPIFMKCSQRVHTSLKTYKQMTKYMHFSNFQNKRYFYNAGRIRHLENMKSYMSYVQQYTKIIKMPTMKTYFS